MGDKSLYIQPTIFSGVKDHMRIAKEEVTTFSSLQRERKGGGLFLCKEIKIGDKLSKVLMEHLEDKYLFYITIWNSHTRFYVYFPISWQKLAALVLLVHFLVHCF